jgi:hypothetical protein
MLVLTEAEQSFVFSNVSEAPVPSLLRTFSAPVVLEHEFSDADLLTLLAHDSDPFNQWEASQRLGLRYALKAIAASGEASAEILPQTSSKPCAACCATTSWTRRSRTWCSRCRPRAISPSSWPKSIRSACMPCAKP